MTTNDEIVNLIIDAQNLGSDELKSAAKDVEGLGLAARKAEKELDQLKVDAATLQSFEQMGSEVRSLKREFAAAEVEYEKSSKALRSNKNATDEQRRAVKESKLALDEQRTALRSQQREYEKLRKEAKSLGANTKTLAEQQERLNKEIKVAEQHAKKLNAAYSDQGDKLKRRVVAQKESIGLTDKESTKNAELIVTLKKYESALNELNKEKHEGTLTTGDYIRAEDKLRKELKLTAAQAKVTRQAVEADGVAAAKKTRNTDLLTSATRRLAQAYTVLLAAQKAAEAVGAGVKEYGALESAITKVEKTTGLARDKIVEMTDQMRTLSEDVTPTATNELLRYAEVAGQLGVNSSEDILKLVAAADALEVSTNLAGDEAALLLTRILGMTGEGVPAINGLASSVVDLGNNFAATEDEIVHMTKEIVSGTRSINLSSSAAAAFGTVLKELGQPAERSRTAIQRMAEAIKKASLEGGDELEQLSNITGLTADEIEKNLGERPEAVLISFIEGLDRVRENGGLVSKSLASMGIAGTEANSVISTMAGSTHRFREALELSNSAFEDQDKHFQEAVKSYSTQDAALAKLVNKFTTLKVKIGETFSDETNDLVNLFGTTIDENSEQVVTMFEHVAELGQGLGEIVTALGEVSAVLNVFGGSFTNALAMPKILINEITLALRGAGLALNEMFIWVAEATDGTQEEIEALRNKSKDLAASMTTDVEDIRRGFARLNGESSATYEDLIDAATEYGDAVSKLSEKQQAQVAEIIKSNEYNEDSESLYRELTAAIILSNREIQVEGQIKKNLAKVSKEVSEVKKEEVKTQKTLNEVISETTTAQQEAIEAAKELNERVEQSVVSSEFFTGSLTSQSKAVRELSLQEIDLGRTVDDLRKKLDDVTKSERERLQITLDLADAEQALIDVGKRKAIQLEIEGKRISELVKMQELQLRNVKDLEFNYRSGKITYGEYADAMDDLRIKSELLTEAIGDNDDLVKSSTDTMREKTSAILEQAEATKVLNSEIDANITRLQRQRGEMVAVSTVTSGADEKAAALIKEIGLEAYNKLLRGTLKYTAGGVIVNRLAQQRLQQQKEEAWERSRAGNTSTQATPSGSEGKAFGTGNTVHTVEIKLPSGNTTTVNTTSVEDANNLIGAIGAIGEINTQGIN